MDTVEKKVAFNIMHGIEISDLEEPYPCSQRSKSNH